MAQPRTSPSARQSAQKPSPVLWSCKQRSHRSESHPLLQRCPLSATPSLCSVAQVPCSDHKNDRGQAEASDPKDRLPEGGDSTCPGEGALGRVMGQPSHPRQGGPAELGLGGQGHGRASELQLLSWETTEPLLFLSLCTLFLS